MKAAIAKKRADAFHTSPDRECEQLIVKIKDAADRGEYALDFSMGGLSGNVCGFIIKQLEEAGYKIDLVPSRKLAQISWKR